MKTEAQKLIMNAYKLSGEKYKDKLEQAFPELFQPFKNGDWIKTIGRDTLLKITDFKKKSAYGFWDGNWVKESSDWTFKAKPEHWQKATEAEVITAFEKEFEKRGFKEGVKFKDPICETVREFKGLHFKYFFDKKIIENHGQCIYSNLFTIYIDGVFAEIVEEPKTIEQRLEIVEQFINEYKNQ